MRRAGSKTGDLLLSPIMLNKTDLVQIFHVKVVLRTPHHFEKKLKIHQMQQKNYRYKFEGVNGCYSLLSNRAIQTNSGVMMHQNFGYDDMTIDLK